MTAPYDVAAIGNAIVDVIAPCDDAFLESEGLVKGSMQLVDAARSADLYTRMQAAIEASGGSAGNTIAGVASFGGSAAYLGKVADDKLGDVFFHDMNAQGVRFDTPRLIGGAPSAVCMINVTPDGQRTMCTYLGASTELTPDDVTAEVVEEAKIVYLEGYLFDPNEARRAFAKAAGLAHAKQRLMAITLSDSFVVERHRDALMGFVDTQCDIVFANEAEVKAMFQTDDFDAAAKALAGKVAIAAITRGEHGSLVLSGAERHEVPAYAVDKVIDTTGAGDQYAAGFLFGLARERSLETCAKLGALAAAEVISHYGPRPLVSLKALAADKGLI
jgi:sugar/nucleoside kinase (ribokinase family)